MNEQVVLPDAGRHARDVAARHVHQIDLVEGIARLALALEDELPAVLRPVALAGASSFDGETADSREEITLGKRGLCAWSAAGQRPRPNDRRPQRQRQQTNKQQASDV